MKDRIEKTAGVLGGKLVSRQEKDQNGPKQGRPPGPKEPAHVGFGRYPPPHLVQWRRGLRVPPGLFSQAKSPAKLAYSIR
jgi:hypothetical protein